MSIMAELKKYAGDEGTTPYKRPRLPESSPEAKELGQVMETAPIPGQSLTQNPDNPAPYERPAEYTDLQEFLEESFLTMTTPEKLPLLLDSLRKGIPIEYITEKYLMNSFSKGEISADLLMLAIEPTIYTMIALATYADIDPVLYPEDDMADDEETDSKTKMYKQASRDLMAKYEEQDIEEKGKLTVDDVQAPSNAPRSLLARAKKAVGSVESESQPMKTQGQPMMPEGQPMVPQGQPIRQEK